MPDSPGPFTTDAADLADGERLVIRLRVPLAALTDPPPPDACPIRVVTASGSIYKFDPHTMTAFRLPNGGAELRRGGERMHLLSWPEPVMGECLVLQLLVREDGLPTVRRTTPVVRINYR